MAALTAKSQIWASKQPIEKSINRELDVVPDLVMSGALQHIDQLHVDWTRWPSCFSFSFFFIERECIECIYCHYTTAV